MGERPRIGAIEIALAAVAGCGVLAIWTVQLMVVPGFVDVLMDFGSTTVLPWITRAVIEAHVAIAGSVLGVAAGGIGLAFRQRPALIGALAVAILTVALQIYGLYAPIFEVASEIR